MSTTRSRLPLGGVLVGGQSRRFGSDKAAASLGGRSMAEWAVTSLRDACGDPVVLLGGSEEAAERLALPWRPDVHEGAGPMAGVAVGLAWAGELERNGLLVLACDLPLVSASLLRTILTAVDWSPDAVVPLTREPPGVQPLCAWYGASALPHLLASLRSGEYSMRALIQHLELRFVRIEPATEEAEQPFLNVNTPEQLELAEDVVAARQAAASSAAAARERTR